MDMYDKKNLHSKYVPDKSAYSTPSIIQNNDDLMTAQKSQGREGRS